MLYQLCKRNSNHKKKSLVMRTYGDIGSAREEMCRLQRSNEEAGVSYFINYTVLARIKFGKEHPRTNLSKRIIVNYGEDGTPMHMHRSNSREKVRKLEGLHYRGNL